MAKIISVEPKEKYFAVKIQDIYGKTDNYKVWNNNEQIKDLRPNSEINIINEENGTYGLILKKFTVIKEGRLGLTEEEKENLFKEITESGADYYILDLLKCNKERFCAAPAARKHHHAYIGGLLQHTNEVLKEVFSGIYSSTESLSRLVDAAILHDFGKIFEYNIDTETGIITYNEDFRKELGLEGSKIAPHIMWAYNWCIERGFVPLAQIVAGHHGLIEHGSMFIPQSPEAHLLYIADYKSSKLGKITVDLLEDAIPF